MRKVLSLLLALVLMFTCLTLTGCGSKNTPADDNIDTQDDTNIEADTSGDSEQSTPIEDSSDERNIKPDADGYYTYKVCNGFAELRIKTNVWDYIDKDNVWDATRMAADLGFTNPTYWDKTLNGFETENKMYKIVIWSHYEKYYINSHNLVPSYSFSVTYGSERGDGGPINMNEAGIHIYEEGFKENAQYGLKDSNAYRSGYMFGVSFNTIVFTAAGMEECNGTIPASTITDNLAMFHSNTGARAYLIP